MKAILLLAPAYAVTVACGPGPTRAEQYPGAWTDPSSEVMRVLAKNRTRGCGEFYQKAGPSRGEYAIACTRDGKRWTGYLVFTGTGEVLGPDEMLVYEIGGPPKEFAEQGAKTSSRKHSDRAAAALNDADFALERADPTNADSFESAAAALDRAADEIDTLANEKEEKK